MSINDILDEEFNTVSKEEISQSDDIQKAMELINKENPFSKLPVKEEIKKETYFDKKELVTKAKKELKDMTITELMEEDELDNIASLAENAFKDLLVEALNSGPKAMAEIAAVAAKFLDTKKDIVNTKVENRFKREKLQLDKAKFESQSAPKKPDVEADIIEQELPDIIEEA